MYRPYGIIDLHCDTLTGEDVCTADFPDTMNCPAHALSIDGIPQNVNYAQFFAVFVPGKYRGQASVEYFEKYRKEYYRQIEKYSGKIVHCMHGSDIEKVWDSGRTAAFLTIEDGSVLNGDPERVHKLREQGVSLITLTWNGENEIGSGHDTEHGLSDFGREVIPMLEEEGILVDISHLNDPGVFEVFEIAKKPFAASHSNARAVCGHKRNLTDEMIREMVRRKCLIGLNYYVSFLKDGAKDPKDAGPDDLYRHIMHFLELGAENVLALGSDNDGCTLPEFMKDPGMTAAYYEYLLGRGISIELADRIFYRNAQEFLVRNL